ncbi:MAG TPA: DUF1152 domain-containing protein [Candidatus Nanoarchaeia archaeon]|nr:DUF1152 domain-containing protein [Candidatus Nanoarchaeia archaeon]
MTKVLASGLGGGLDVVNALLIYAALENEGNEPVLGSIRPIVPEQVFPRIQFSENGCWVDRDSRITGYNGRCVEPKIAAALGKDILLFSRRKESEREVEGLAEAIADMEHLFSDMFFVDGGGDSLILKKEDAIAESEYKDPFQGEDAVSLAALTQFPNAYLAVISVGLDISEEAFRRNVDLLSERGAYFGRVNLVSGEKEGRSLEGLERVIQFQSGFLDRYFTLAEKILVLKEEDIADPSKTKSHTAVVAYHALKGNFGLQRTFVRWEPTVDGQKGVLVNPEHQWMYFFKASAVHPLKKELNPGHSYFSGEEQ